MLAQALLYPHFIIFMINTYEQMCRHSLFVQLCKALDFCLHEYMCKTTHKIANLSIVSRKGQFLAMAISAIQQA